MYQSCKEQTGAGGWIRDVEEAGETSHEAGELPRVVLGADVKFDKPEQRSRV